MLREPVICYLIVSVLLIQYCTYVLYCLTTESYVHKGFIVLITCCDAERLWWKAVEPWRTSWKQQRFVQKHLWDSVWIVCTTHTYTHLTALFPGLPGRAGTRKVKPIWILLKQETMSDSGISCAVCKSAPRSSQIITPAPHHSLFYRPDALLATQPTASNTEGMIYLLLLLINYWLH